MTEELLNSAVAGVRFSRIGKVYHFLAYDIPDLKTGDQVIVETVRGRQMGEVVQILPIEAYPDSNILKTIERRATPRDLMLHQGWQEQEARVVESAQRRAKELRLRGIKIVGAEYAFDGSRLAVLFSTESEEKYDLKSLRMDMQREFQPALVEMRQIGPRDLAKLLCGMGACGLENRCCSQFLCEFSSISIRMAKEQGISLTPTEITGMCGRLRCCLIYEYEQYTAARALLPRKNKRVMTPAGEGRVLEQIPLRDAVLVALMDDTRREFPRAELQLIGEDGALTPAMSDEELAVYRSHLPVAEAEPEPLPAAAYTLPPQAQVPARKPQVSRQARRDPAAQVREKRGPDPRTGKEQNSRGVSRPTGVRRPQRPINNANSAGSEPGESSKLNAQKAVQKNNQRNDFRRRGGRDKRPQKSDQPGNNQPSTKQAEKSDD